MKVSRCELASNYANLRGEMGVDSRGPCRYGQSAARHVDVRNLSESVNSGICTPSPVQFHRCCKDLRKSALQMILNSVLVWLTLPSAEWLAVIRDGELQTFERRAHCKESR